MENNHDNILMLKAIEISNLSHANKRKVGCVIANHHTGEIISIGYNKMFDNLGFVNCEDNNNETIPYVIHAEEMAIIEMLKHLKFIKNINDLTLYVSYAPCINCAKYIAHIGIRRILYHDKHINKFDVVNHSPSEFFKLMNITVIQYQKEKWYVQDLNDLQKDDLKGIDDIHIIMKSSNQEMVESLSLNKGVAEITDLKKLNDKILSENRLENELNNSNQEHFIENICNSNVAVDDIIDDCIDYSDDCIDYGDDGKVLESTEIDDCIDDETHIPIKIKASGKYGISTNKFDIP